MDAAPSERYRSTNSAVTEAAGAAGGASPSMRIVS